MMQCFFFKFYLLYESLFTGAFDALTMLVKRLSDMIGIQRVKNSPSAVPKGSALESFEGFGCILQKNRPLIHKKTVSA